jgi:hypothetical protein
MRFDDDVWYAKWFFWSLGIRDAFRPYWKRKEEKIREQGTTNLCFFIRTMVFTAPIILLLHATVYGAAVLTLTWVPVKLFGAKSYFSIIGAIALIALVVLGLKRMPRKEQSPVRLPVKRYPYQTVDADVTASRKNPTFVAVVIKWLVAIDQKICPTIEITYKQGVRR